MTNSMLTESHLAKCSLWFSQASLVLW